MHTGNKFNINSKKKFFSRIIFSNGLEFAFFAGYKPVFNCDEKTCLV